VDQGLAGRIVSEREAVIVDDLSSAEPLLREAGVQSLLGVPLLTEGRVHGVLHVGSVQSRRFTHDQAHLLRLVADRVALAINQSRLYEAERAERQRAERLAAEWQTTLGQIADGVLITDPGGQISFMNEAARELFGFRDSRPRRVQDLPIAARGTATFAETPLGRALQRGETVRDAEISIARADGTHVFAIGSAAPVVAEDGTRLGAVRTLHDVTAQRELERQREEFFTNASHDLRTPVATIKSSIEVLLQNEPPGTTPVLHQLLTNIDREADRMATLVNDLLELTRLRTGRAPLRIERTDLRTVATRARDAIAPLIEKRQQQLEFVLPRTRLVAAVDAERLERAVLNLLSNAQKYGYAGGVVTLTLARQGQNAVFSVADNGPGIPEADNERIFERFYRAETEVTRRNQGSGLGLPIARATAELHGGRLRLAPTPGGGTTFSLSIPLRSFTRRQGHEDPDRR
jgi:PAS domain S-box-containing protein